MSSKTGMLGAEPSGDVTVSQDDTEAGNLQRRSQQLQAQIAEALGLPVTAFHMPETIRQNLHDPLDAAQEEALTLNRDCSALIEAYTSISDPRERQRLLEIVRAAAGRPDKT